MVDFSNVAAKQVTAENTATYELYDIDMEGAALLVAPATRSNKAFNNAQTALMLPQQRRIQGGKLNAAFLDKYRADLRRLYAGHVVKGWSKIVDSSGTEASFNTEDCLRFLEALPNQSFDALVEFCENESNFRVTADEDLAKN